MREDRSSSQWEVESNPSSNPPVLFRDVWLFSATEEAVLPGQAEEDWVGDMMEADKINNNASSYGGEPGLMTEGPLKVERDKNNEDRGPGSETGVVVSLLEGESVVSSVGFNILEEAGIFLEDEVNQCLKEEEESKAKMNKIIAETNDAIAKWSQDMEKDSKERARVADGAQKDSKLSGGRRSRRRKDLERFHPDLAHSFSRFRPFNKTKLVLTNPDSGVSPGKKRPLGWHFDGKDYIFYDSVREKDQQKVIDEILEDDKKGSSLCKVEQTKKRTTTPPKGGSSGKRNKRLKKDASTSKVEKEPPDDWIRKRLCNGGGVADEDYEPRESPEEEYDTDSSVSSFSSADSLFRPIRRIKRRVTRSQFICTVCVRSFTDLEDLQIHQRSHYFSQEKPYSCNKCKNGFIAASYLEYHQKNSDCSREIDSISSVIPSSASTSTSASSQLKLAQPKIQEFEGIKFKEARIILTRLPLESYPKSFKDKLQWDAKDENNKDLLKLLGYEMPEETEQATTPPSSRALSYLCPYCHTCFDDASDLIEHLPLHDSIGPKASNCTGNKLRTELRRRSRKQSVGRITNDEDGVHWGDGLKKQRPAIHGNVQNRLEKLPLQFEMDILATESESEVLQPQDSPCEGAIRITKCPPEPLVSTNSIKRRQRPHRGEKLKELLAAMSDGLEEPVKKKLKTAQERRDLEENGTSNVDSDGDWHPHKNTSVLKKTLVKGVAQKVNGSRNAVMEKMFECTICGKRFSRGDNLKKHFNRAHSGRITQKNPEDKAVMKSAEGEKVRSECSKKPYKCYTCSKTFGSKSDRYYHHIKVHHPNDNLRKNQKPQETLTVTYGQLKISVPPCEVRLVRCDHLPT